MDLRKRGWAVVHWIHLIHKRDQWWALVNMIMKFGVHKIMGISLLTERLLAP